MGHQSSQPMNKPLLLIVVALISLSLVLAIKLNEYLWEQLTPAEQQEIIKKQRDQPVAIPWR